jgi:glycosyltransferase involved in cell wall biosynthesis
VRLSPHAPPSPRTNFGVAAAPGAEIVLYCDSPLFGGFERLVVRLASDLSANGWRVELMFWHDAFAEAIADQRIVMTRLAAPARTPFTFLWAFDPFAIRRISRKFRERRSSTIVVCQPTIEVGANALLAARLAGVDVVSYLALAFDLRTIGATRFIVLSEFQRSLVRARVGTPSSLLPMIVTTSCEPIEVAQRDRISIGVIGTVATRTKGQDAVVDLSRALAAHGTDARIEIIGDGPDLDSLQSAIARSGESARIACLGSLPNEEVRRRIRKFDVVLIPSRWEGAVPLVAFESVAEGVPFVISDLPSLAEWDIPSELRFDRNSAADMVRAIDAAVAFRRSPKFDSFRSRMLETVAETGFANAARRIFSSIRRPHT